MYFNELAGSMYNQILDVSERNSIYVVLTIV